MKSGMSDDEARTQQRLLTHLEALLDVDPLVATDGRLGSYHCHYCYRWARYDGTTFVVDHRDQCVYIAAKAFVRDLGPANAIDHTGEPG